MKKIALAPVQKRKLVEDKVFCCQVTNVGLLSIYFFARALKYLGITFCLMKETICIAKGRKAKCKIDYHYNCKLFSKVDI